MITNIKWYNIFSLITHLFSLPFRFLLIIAAKNGEGLFINAALSYYLQKKKWLFLRNNIFFFYLDSINLYFLSINNASNSTINYRLLYRQKQVNWSFYTKTVHNKFFIHYLSGIKFIFQAIKFLIFGMVLALVSVYYLLFIKLLPFAKIIFEWTLIVMFLYWLLSGFVFFIKRYQYSKFTSVIQRFWKRTYMLFWLIEGGVFLVFFFLTVNAPEEPIYMYDTIKLYKTHLFSWRIFLLKIVPVITLIIFCYYLLLSIKWVIFTKQTQMLLVITLLLIYVFWLEFYQFFHVISNYGNLTWVFDTEDYLWNLDIEFKRTRIVNNTLAICLLAKFWHLVFIFVFWFFFILRVNEIGRVRYALFASNIQNFIILYIMSWLYMYPWLKYVLKRYTETSYFWFFFNARRLGLRVFFNDIQLFISNITNFNFSFYYFKTGSFYYLFETSSDLTLQFKKFIIRDYLITLINN